MARWPFMAELFAAEYSKIFNHPDHFETIARQFEQVEKHMVDSTTGLLYHGFDESREQGWANKRQDFHRIFGEEPSAGMQWLW